MGIGVVTAWLMDTLRGAENITNGDRCKGLELLDVHSLCPIPHCATGGRERGREGREREREREREGRGRERERERESQTDSQRERERERERD